MTFRSTLSRPNPRSHDDVVIARTVALAATLLLSAVAPLAALGATGIDAGSRPPPPGSAAATLPGAVVPTPSRPATIRFQAGTHTGLRRASSGAVIGTKTVTLSRRSSASAIDRAVISGRGTHLLVSTGLFAGLWLPETALSYLPGIAGDVALPAGTSIRFSAGTYLGYRFDAAWKLEGTRRATLTRASSARADRGAVINGRTYTLVGNGIWAGTWMPGSAALPLPVACRAGPRPDATPRTIRTVTTAGDRIALTFDGGGRLDPARDILEYLILDRVCATIFPTGAMAASSDGQAVLGIVRDHPELFEVGNHTQRHCDLVRGGGGTGCPTGPASTTFIASELRTAATAIVAASGQSPIPYWRPPYGAVDSRVTAAAAAAGYRITVMWATDTIDWRPVADGGPTAITIASRIRAAPRGAVVLLHLGGYNTLDALPWAIAGIRERGLLPTSVSELLRGS